MKLFKNEEEAVSPVIGVILMVAIVVILAAVIAAFVFGMAGGVQSTKTVAATAKYVADDQVEITYQGGNDHSDLEFLKIGVSWVTNGTAISTSYTDGANVSSTNPPVAQPPVGSKFVVGGGGINQNSVVVTASFSDGSEQVILDTRV